MKSESLKYNDSTNDCATKLLIIVTHHNGAKATNGKRLATKRIEEC